MRVKVVQLQMRVKVQLYISIVSVAFKEFFCLFPGLRHAPDFAIHDFEKLLDIVPDVFAKNKMFADGPVPEEIGVCEEAFALLFAELMPAFLHVLASPIQSENHDVAAYRIHLCDSLQHVFVHLSFRHLVVIGEQIYVFLYALALYVLKVAQYVLNLVLIDFFVKLLGFAEDAGQPCDVVVQIVLALDVFS